MFDSMNVNMSVYNMNICNLKSVNDVYKTNQVPVPSNYLNYF